MAPYARARLAGFAVLLVALVALPQLALAPLGEPLLARAALLAGIALALWLSEIVPPYAPTWVLLAGVPLLLGPLRAGFGVADVLRWALDPVVGLFFGGFTLGLAATRYGFDSRITGHVLRASRGRGAALLALVMGGTALLSMWISNIAAAALMLGSLRPVLSRPGLAPAFRSTLLLGVALGANLGGMATPIGSGPNAIALAALEGRAPVTFLGWMAFAVPLTALALGAAYLMLRVRAGRLPDLEVPEAPAAKARPGASAALVVFALTVAAWLTEPLHHVSAPVVAMAAAVALLASRLLRSDDLRRMDWSTLTLIAGGITLGRLLDRSGLVERATAGVDWAALPAFARLAVLVLASATLSALMSNTATAAMLVPLAMRLDPAPSTAVLVALGASFGIPFSISTPPNAMAVGAGLPSRELARVGLPLMLLGCLWLALTGPAALAALGVR